MQNLALNKVKWIGAVLCALVSYVVFFLTMAPTVSFWDCGEFIAVSNILGIPHPPGTPFFVILGRVAIVLMPWIGEVAARVNLISVFSSALAVFFCFLTAWEALAAWFRSRDELESPAARWALPVAGAVASFLVAFSDTFWFNAVEAEVYGLAMCFVFCVTWLSLVWARHAGTDFGDRLLVLICYVAYLGIGIQLYTLITLPALFAFVVAVDERFRRRESIPFWVVCVLLYAVVYKVDVFPEVLVLSILATGVCALVFRGGNASPLFSRIWKLSFWFAVVAFLGFSNHAYIPIRSALDPAIDENDPEIHVESALDLLDQDKWGAFNSFLARKQYGSESMITRAFHRRAKFDNQLLTWPHMGFGGYQFAQYLPWKVGEVRFGRDYGKFYVDEADNPPLEKLGIEFPTQMMLFKDNPVPQVLIFLVFNGAIFLVCRRLWRRDPKTAGYVAALYLTTTAGLLFYMNFADGLGSEGYAYRQWLNAGSPAPGPQTVQLEVRERDYFYTPGFMMMGILFGIGAGLAVEALWRRRGAGLAKKAGTALAAVSLVLPLGVNWGEHDRSGNFIPWDYAYNLLNSCEKDGVLFTNGDNDTFPLWFIQEVEGVRKDVRVVNLSLGNTDWYVRQILENEPKLRLEDLRNRLAVLDTYEGLVRVDDAFAGAVSASVAYADSMIGKTERQIDSLKALGNPDADRKAEIAQGNRARLLDYRQMNSAMEEWLANYRPTFLKVQDQLVIDVMLSNPDRPFHFATTVGRENFVGLDKYMDMQGMVYTLRRGTKEPQGRLDLERTVFLVDSVYRYRCLEDRSCYVNDETRRLLYNYNSVYYRVVMDARRELASAMPMLEGLRSADSVATPEVQAMRADLEARADAAFDRGQRFLARALRQFPEEWRTYVIGADFWMTAGRPDEALKLLESGLDNVPSYDRGEIESRRNDVARFLSREKKAG